MKIGVISDTHGVIHPGVFDHLASADIILHAGDIGTQEILTDLESIAPVKAVAGNTDGFPITQLCKRHELLELAGKKIFLVHRVIERGRHIPWVAEEILKVEPDIVVFGHTHEPYAEVRDGILYFNPGSASRARNGKSLGVGIINIKNGSMKHDIICLNQELMV